MIEEGKPKSAGTVSFGPFRLVPAERRLEKAGAPVPLGGRALDLLIILVERAGEVVSKQELFARVWGNVTVEEVSLRFQITALRKALGEGETGSQYVANVAGRGYCFAHSVSRSDDPVRPSVEDDASPGAHGLPPRLARIIGRNQDIREISVKLLTHRFVTVVGPGGNGKTTVAVSVAHSLLDQFEGAVSFIGLAALSDPKLVASSIAHALGVPAVSEDAAPSLINFIKKMRLLLVLDNCEHLIESVSSLAERIFLETPFVHILATSRESLRVEGEHIHRLLPLDCPPEDGRLTVIDALEFPAVQLFMERAVANSDRPQLRHEEAQTVAEICRKLDGIPLAIEFAAARVGTLGVFGVATHLTDRFALLTKGRRTALPRHQTLRAALDWSYELLPESEQRLLRCLAVFAGGFTFQAATAIMRDDGYDDLAVAEGISNLVSKSLLTLDGAARAARWHLLDTTRAYALGKLGDGAEMDATARRHAKFFMQYFESIDTRSKIEATTESLIAYRQEIDNVRAALDWSFSPDGEPSIGAALTSAYAWVWLRLSLYFECTQRTSKALEYQPSELDLTVSARLQLLLSLAMSLTNNMESVDRIETVLNTALQIAERHDKLADQLWILWALWSLQLNTGQCRAAQSTAVQYNLVAPRTGDVATILPGHRLLGTALHLGGDQLEAKRHLERALAPPFSEVDPQHPVWPKQHRAMVLATLARTRWLQGFADQAREMTQQSFEAVMAMPDGQTRFEVFRLAVCPIAFVTGDLDAAERALASTAEITDSSNAIYWKFVVRCFESRLLIKRGEFEKGSIMLRTALESCDSGGWKPGYPEHLSVLAEGMAGLGRYADAVDVVNLALAAADSGGECWVNAELLRLKGDFRLRETTGHAADEAEGWFREALQLARRQGALAWELRAAVSLARLLVGRERNNDAHQLLAPVYERFTEGFDTPDLVAARRLMDDLT